VYGVAMLLERFGMKEWWPLPDSNRGPDDYESYALTN
jgi:hypothetical protein